MESGRRHEEEAAINNLPEIAGREVPFVVPAGYFENLPVQLMERIHLEELSRGSATFPVPGNYFEELPGRIQSNIAADQLKGEIPEDGFTVPAGYFETLSDRVIMATGAERAPVKIRRLSSWIGYAAAACITLAVAAGLLLNQEKPVTLEDRLAAIPDQEIIRYLQDHSSPGDASFIKENIDDASGLSGHNAISSQEIEQYLDNTL